MILCLLTSIQFSWSFLGYCPMSLPKARAAFLSSLFICDYHFPWAFAAYSFISFYHHITSHLHSPLSPSPDSLILALAISQGTPVLCSDSLQGNSSPLSRCSSVYNHLQIFLNSSKHLTCFLCPVFWLQLFPYRSCCQGLIYISPLAFRYFGDNAELDSSFFILPLICKAQIRFFLGAIIQQVFSSLPTLLWAKRWDALCYTLSRRTKLYSHFIRTLTTLPIPANDETIHSK